MENRTRCAVAASSPPGGRAEGGGPCPAQRVKGVQAGRLAARTRKSTGQACPAASSRPTGCTWCRPTGCTCFSRSKDNKVMGATENAAGGPRYKQREGRLRVVCPARERTQAERTVCDLNSSLLKKFGYPSGRGGENSASRVSSNAGGPPGQAAGVAWCAGGRGPGRGPAPAPQGSAHRTEGGAPAGPRPLQPPPEVSTWEPLALAGLPQLFCVEHQSLEAAGPRGSLYMDRVLQGAPGAAEPGRQWATGSDHPLGCWGGAAERRGRGPAAGAELRDL